MRLTILGGSAASPNAGMGCAGLLVLTDRTRLVLDLGPGTLQELRRHTDFRTLDAVIVSHMHVDHVLDLLALRHALAYNPLPAPGSGAGLAAAGRIRAPGPGDCPIRRLRRSGAIRGNGPSRRV